MRAFLRNRNIAIFAAVALVICLGAANLAWSLSAQSRGRRAALADLPRGQYVLLDPGLHSPERYEVARLLRERYDIELRFVPGGSSTMVAYVRGYNGVIVAAATAKFGHNVYKECSDEAHRVINIPGR